MAAGGHPPDRSPDRLTGPLPGFASLDEPRGGGFTLFLKNFGAPCGRAGDLAGSILPFWKLAKCWISLIF
jgi:hypothetical protein